MKKIRELMHKMQPTAQERKVKAIYRAWDRERAAAGRYGSNHVNEIDAIFSRHLNNI